jgi:HEAT repeat protein
VNTFEEDDVTESRYQKLLEDGNGPKAMPKLLEALHDSSWRVRKAAADLVGRSEPTPELTEKLLAVLRERGETGARNAAAAALSQMGEPVVPALVGVLSDADPDQRKFAADILASIGSADAVPALVRALDDADENVRVSAAEALAKAGGQEAGRALERLLESDSALERISALEGLAQLDRPPPLPKLLGFLDGQTARSAFRLLGRMTHAACFTALCRALLGPHRDPALAGLGARETPLSADEEHALRLALERVSDVESFLKNALAADDLYLKRGGLWASAVGDLAVLSPQVAEAAEGGELAEASLRSLLRLGLEGARVLLSGEPAAISALSREGRAVAGEALMRLSEPALVAPLARLAASGDLELTEIAARALGKSKAKEAVTPLSAVLEEDLLASPAARGLAALGAQWPAEVAAALETALEDRVLPHALRAYAKVAPRPKVVAWVKRALHEPEPRARAAAAECAGELDTDGIDLLTTALVDESPLVRKAAARALAGQNPNAVFHLLERALEDSEPNVQAAAAVAAGELAERKLEKRLLEKAASPHGSVALHALQALLRFTLPEPKVVEQATKHGDPEVVKAALGAAAELREGPKWAVELLKHSRWDVRVAAARTLSVAGGREALIPLHAAVERETDPLARELLVQSAAALADR